MHAANQPALYLQFGRKQGSPRLLQAVYRQYTGCFSIRRRSDGKYSQASGNVFVFFDAQLYANELADAVKRGEKTNNTNAVKLDSEMKRCAKGIPRLTNGGFQALQSQDLMEIHSEIPERGMVTIRTNRTDLNCMQVYSVYTQRQAID